MVERRGRKQRRPFKIKEILPEEKTDGIKRKYTGNKSNKSQKKVEAFSGRNRLIFQGNKILYLS